MSGIIKVSYSKTRYLRIPQWYVKLHSAASGLNKPCYVPPIIMVQNSFIPFPSDQPQKPPQNCSLLKPTSRVISEVNCSALEFSSWAYSSSHTLCALRKSSWNSSYIVPPFFTHAHSPLDNLWDFISKKQEVFPGLLNVSPFFFFF